MPTRAYRAVQTKALLFSSWSCREMGQTRRQFHRLPPLMEDRETQAASKDDDDQDQMIREGEREVGYNSSTWVPHPRTGIYFPEGHEWVMKDVPENAASFKQLFWLRNSDGLDDDEEDHHHHKPSAGSRFAAVFNEN